VHFEHARLHDVHVVEEIEIPVVERLSRDADPLQRGVRAADDRRVSLIGGVVNREVDRDLAQVVIPEIQRDQPDMIIVEVNRVENRPV